MIFGVRAHDYGKLPADELFSAISGHGWQAVQLAFPKAITGVDSFGGVTPEIIAKTKEALDASGLSVAVLGVYVDPSLVDENERATQASFLSAAIPQAKALNAGCVGTETTVRGPHSDMRALYRSLEELLPEAELHGVNIGIEPVFIHNLSTPELTAKMLRDFSSTRLKTIFDPINLLKLEDVDSQNDLWARCLDCFGDHIVAVHIKGAYRQAGENTMLTDAPFASSVVDYGFLFSLLKTVGAPILREGVVPSEAAGDLAFLRGLL